MEYRSCDEERYDGEVDAQDRELKTHGSAAVTVIEFAEELAETHDLSRRPCVPTEMSHIRPLAGIKGAQSAGHRRTRPGSPDPHRRLCGRAHRDRDAEAPIAGKGRAPFVGRTSA